MSKIKPGLIILSILVLALFLRVYNLAGESLWIDEFIAIDISSSEIPVIIARSISDNNPPVYYLVLHYWIAFFGDSEFSIRFPSVIFGFISILVVYKLSESLFDRKTALLSALISALSLFHIYYSQEARNYSLMTLLSLLSIYFFVKFLEKRSSTSMIFYVISNSLLVYTHTAGLFIILVQNIYFFTQFISSKKSYKKALSEWIIMQSLLGILLYLWIRAATVSTPLEVTPTIFYLFDTFLEYSGSLLLLLLFLILCLFPVTTKKIRANINWKGVRKFLDSSSSGSGVYLLLLILFVPVISQFIISQSSISIYWTRYTLPSSLALYILVARVIKEIKHKQTGLVVISLIILLSLANIWTYYAEPNKTRWREAAAYIDTNAKTGDLVLFAPSCIYNNESMKCNSVFFQEALLNYYSNRTDLAKTGPLGIPPIKDEIVSDVEGYDRVWVTMSETRDWSRVPNHYDYSEQLVIETLSENYSLKSYQDFVSIDYTTRQEYKGVEVYLFEKP